MKKEFYGTVSITAKLSFAINAENEEEATNKLFNAACEINLIDPKGNVIEITDQDWTMIKESQEGNIKEHLISDFEIMEEKY